MSCFVRYGDPLYGTRVRGTASHFPAMPELITRVRPEPPEGPARGRRGNAGRDHGTITG